MLPSPLAGLTALALLLGGCATDYAPPGPAVMAPAETPDAFVMPDGMRLPYRVWLPGSTTGMPIGQAPIQAVHDRVALPPSSPGLSGGPEPAPSVRQEVPRTSRGMTVGGAAAKPPDKPPWAVVLALHGMNDSRDAWEIPGPEYAAAGVALYAPDQRGFGATAARGRWPGAQGLVDDARTMAALLRARYPRTPLYLMGESMGAAVLMVLATGPHPPAVDGYVLSAPAVWGRAKMNPLLRGLLWTASRTVPGLVLENRGYVKVTASDNRDALRRLSRDPLTLRGTRVDAVRGLVDLMDAALAAAPAFRAPALFLYGGKDDLVPKRATVATWRALPSGPRRAYYPERYHLAMRDLGRATVLSDVIAWMRNPTLPLASGADRAAAGWVDNEK